MNIQILDTTLRDGLQAYDVNYSLSDRVKIINTLRKLNLTIEMSNPSASAVDRALISQFCTNNSDLVVFGSTMRKLASPSTDLHLTYLAEQPIEQICIFGKASISQARDILGVSPQENIEIISQSIAYLCQQGKSVIFDAEHFFDGYTESPQYAASVVAAAAASGAKTVVLCDTNGGSIPSLVGAATRSITTLFPDIIIGIHCHNDCGLAVANSLAAYDNGATHFQGTLLGFGERCGNTSLSTLIPLLELKLGCVTPCHESLSLLTQTSRMVAEITNVALEPTLPFVGAAAFSHKAGMHIDAIIKSSDSFEHVSPAAVGNHDSLVISQLSGKTALYSKINEVLPDIKLSQTELSTLLATLKDMESLGYTYESAEASFTLLVKRYVNQYRQFFDLISYKVISDNATANSAVIKIAVGGENSLACGEGVGAVNALDRALRQALARFYPAITDITLTDYKVRVLDSIGATSAKVRVLITTTAPDGTSWSTVGVSADIIEASFIALSDSINYWLSIN